MGLAAEVHASRASVAAVLLLLCAPGAASAAAPPVHGLWVWNSAAVLQAPQGAATLADFCRATDINEVYVPVSANYSALEALQLAQLIGLLHEANVQVQALLSSTTADEPGAPRTSLLDHVQAILQFNRDHAAQAFDGIHLDIEPQQRPENKGPGNLGFLPGLIDTYRGVRMLTDRHRLMLEADIPAGVFEAEADQRRALLLAVPRLAVLMNESTGPADATGAARVEASSRRLLQIAYAGVDAPRLARMSVALPGADFGSSLSVMLAALDQANGGDPHYLGWALRSYNAQVP